VNASASHLEPMTRSSCGEAHLLAGALEWRSARTLLEAEFEHSRQSEPSTPGFSLLGNRLPDAADIDPRLNLNNQRWSLPVVMRGDTGSLRATQHLDDDTRVVAHLMRQRLTSDDRIAFPFGCGAEGNFDRYCSDGSFDLYDFRSEGERRTTTAGDLALHGKADLGGWIHRYQVGVMATDYRARFQRQAFNPVGTGRIDGSVPLPPDPTLTDENTERTEHSTELHLQDAIDLGADVQLWAGLRHSRLHRASVRTDGSRATGYAQSFSTPWLGLSWQLDARHMAYASWGEGVESEVSPNRTRYANPGEALPALKSRQFEAGVKHRSDAWQWQLAWFEIRRPQWNDILTSTGLPSDACSDADPCTRRADGAARHRGLEATLEWQQGPWSLRASGMAQRARREASTAPDLNGLRPTNVPERSLKAQAVYNVNAVPGLALLAFVTHEGQRMVLPDNSVSTPGWTRVDLGLRLAQTLGDAKLVWRIGLDNVADQRAWKEAPYQFGHAYLYPLQPRTWHASVQTTW
jgi:iron complex outermembrane receptor protein